MDITPPQFNALLRELKKIREHLEELRKDKEQENAAGNETQERGKEQEFKLPVPLEIKFEENQATEYKTETGKQQSTQNSIRNATWGAFIAASVYAIITMGIAIVSLCQLKEAHDNFVAEQRPYVVVEDYMLHSLAGYKSISQPILGAGFSLELHFRNAGKTPALRAVFQCHVVSDIEKIRPEPLERNQGEGEPIP